MAISCGGVQRNPAAPPFGKDQQPGQLPGQGAKEPGKEGEEGGAAPEAWGEGKIIEGDYESLIVMAQGSLQSGNLEDSYNAYYSAFAQMPGDVQAGFGMAVCRLALNWRTFAIFTGAGADKLFYSTPLVMHPELLPNPINAEDSYLLRIFTIGRRYDENFDVKLPSLVRPLSKKEEGKGPAGSSPEVEHPQPGVGTPGVPVLGEGGGTITPGEEEPGEEIPGVEEPGGEEEEKPKGEEEPEGEEEEPGGEEEPKGEEEGASSMWPENWEPLSQNGGDDLFGGDYTDPDLEEMYKEMRESSDFPLMEAEIPGVEMPGQLPLGDQPIDAAYFAKEVPLTVSELLIEAAGIRMDYQLAMNISNMNTSLVSLITTLEDISEEINQDFIFQAGLVMRDKNARYDLVFRENDYELLLAELKILAGITGFVSAYNMDNGFMYYYNQAEDIDTDGLIRPDEYYPLEPFGLILEDDGEDILSEARDYYIEGLEEAEDAWELVLERAFNAGSETENEMLAISSGGVEAALLEDRKNLYREFASRFYDDLEVDLDSMGSVIEVKVNPSVLFDGSIGDVRALLPCLDASGLLVSCEDSEEIWPDKTFGGLFPDGLDDDATVKRGGKVTGKVSDAGYFLLEEGTISYPGGESEVTKDGDFLLAGVEFNELIGLPVTVKPEGGDPWEGVMHSMMENIITVILIPRTGGALGVTGIDGMPVLPGVGGTGYPTLDGAGGTSTLAPGGGTSSTPG